MGLEAGLSTEKSGGASAGVAFLRAKEDAAQGLRVQYGEANFRWSLRTELLPLSDAPISYLTSDGAANYVGVELPAIFRSRPGAETDFAILVRRGEANRNLPARAASVNIPAVSDSSGIHLRFHEDGPGGNAFVLTVVFEARTTPRFAYTSATAGTLTAGAGYDLSNYLRAINLARYQGSQLVTATVWGSAGLDDSVHHLVAGEHRLSGGRAAASGVRTPLSFTYGRQETPASAVWQARVNGGSETVRLEITAPEGEAGNGISAIFSLRGGGRDSLRVTSDGGLELFLSFDLPLSNYTAGRQVSTAGGTRTISYRLVLSDAALAAQSAGHWVIGNQVRTTSGGIEEEAFVLTVLPEDDLDAIRAAIVALHYSGATPFAGLVTLMGDGSDTLLSALIPSAPGDSPVSVPFVMSGALAPDPVFSVDEDARVVLSQYSRIHLLRHLAAVEHSDIELDLVAGTDPNLEPRTPGEIVGFDFDETGDSDQDGGSFALGELIDQASFANLAQANIFVAPNAADPFPRPDAIATDEVWWLTFSGLNGEIFPIRAAAILDRRATAAAMLNEDFHLAFNRQFIFLAWHQGSLVAATSDTAVQPGVVRAYRAGGRRGLRGLRGLPGEDLEAREVTLRTWQDGQAASAVPDDAIETTVTVGKLQPVQFPKRSNRPRYLHAAVSSREAIVIFSIAGLEQIEQFSAAVSGDQRLYHSPRLRATSALDCLIRVEENS